MQRSLLFVLLVFGLAGCVSAPPVPAARSSERERLISHVRFLAQPALKGRKPGTIGSRSARRYIEGKFKGYGLVPWGKARGYELPFGYGNNVVALLPGSDPDLANEIVLVSAHYDHLGRDRKGRICPGAADNASGVAALLETARRLASLEHRPNRSILFVAFDCEEMMLFGSFAFSCRADVQESKLAAIINMDMLGRDFFDVVRHTLFVVGTERYPKTGDKIRRFGAQAGLQVLPLGTDVIGPRSDHVAFESRGVPCLFFSCGTFKDYHQPEDTAEKLNYEDLERSADVILAIVKELAAVPAVESAAPVETGYREELRAVCTVSSEVNKNPAAAGVKDEDVEAFKKLALEAEELSRGGQYDKQAREKLIVDASGVLAPYFLPVEVTGKDQTSAQRKEARLTMQYLHQFYISYGSQIIEGYRRLVVQLLKYRPGLIRRMPKFDYEFYDIPDADIIMTEPGPDRYVLNALANSWTMIAEVRSSKWLFKSFAAYLGGSLDPIDCEGTRQQLEDFCLLRLRGEQSNALHSAGIRKVLRAVTGTESRGSYETLLARRLQRGTFNGESEWIVSCMLSGAPSLALQAIETVKGTTNASLLAACDHLIIDTNTRPDVRAAAIGLAARANDKQALLTICQLVDDHTPAYQRAFVPMTRKEYPFSDRIVVQAALAILANQDKRTAGQTLGDLAQTQLKKLSKRDYGSDRGKWRAWIESHQTARGP